MTAFVRNYAHLCNVDLIYNVPISPLMFSFVYL